MIKITQHSASSPYNDDEYYKQPFLGTVENEIRKCSWRSALGAGMGGGAVGATYGGLYGAILGILGGAIGVCVSDMLSK